MNNKGYAVITGASSGIGKEFAYQLAKLGYPQVLVARRKDRLETLAEDIKNRYGVECHVFACDLSDAESCEVLVDGVKDLPVEVFINNAGFGDCSPFLEGCLEKELGMIDVNIRAMHILMKRMLEQMHKRGQGYILNVASSAGLVPAGPFMATYYASKAYVCSITQAVSRELKEAGSGVYVGCLCPGPVDTEFNDVAGVELALKGISAKACVEYGIRRMFRKKVVIVPAWYMRAAVFFGRFVPRSLYVAIVGMQQKRKINRG